MTLVNRRVFEGLTGFRSLEIGEPPSSFWSAAGGGIAYGGALRLFPYSSDSALPSYSSWNAPNAWRALYDGIDPTWDSIGEDAFGVQYMLSQGEEPLVSLFWSETGEIENLGVGPGEFLQMIQGDPDNTLSLAVYQACVERYGQLPLSDHFAMRVESALGGAMCVENMVAMNSFVHMRALSQIAKQIRSVSIGTVFVPKKL